MDLYWRDNLKSMMCGYNRLPLPDYSDLIAKYGAKNVENACIFIVQSLNPWNLKIYIPATPERVSEVLCAVHNEYTEGHT